MFKDITCADLEGGAEVEPARKIKTIGSAHVMATWFHGCINLGTFFSLRLREGIIGNPIYIVSATFTATLFF